MYTDIAPVTHHFYPLQEHETIEHESFRDFLKTLNDDKTEKTDNLLYLHIPYCEKRCLFCPFHVRVQRDFDIYNTYTDMLLKEIEMLSKLNYVQNMSFKAIYFGGGSPSLLPVDNIKKLYKAIKNNFHINNDAEWTFEGEPHSLANAELLSLLKDEGTQRISYGVQTFDHELREKMHIGATVDDVIHCLEQARLYGIKEVNIDMMFHLPGHDFEDLEYDISKISDYGFDSVDYYYLSYYGFPKQIFTQMEQGLFPKRPPIGLRFEMNAYVRKRMKEIGFYHATDHVFSKTDPEGSYYYKLLWGGGFGEYRAETLAVGASARGYINGYSYANARSPNAYMKDLENKKLPIFKVSDLLRNPQNRGLVFFPKFFRLNKNLSGYHYPVELFKELIAKGYMEETENSYQLTEKGIDWIPNITIDLMEAEQRIVNNRWIEQLNGHYANRVTL